jgi:diguanylate cyclase (GGDEF)-like protein
MNQLERRLFETGRLPVLPAAARHLLVLPAAPVQARSRVLEALSGDEALTERVLELLNSPLFGRAPEVGSLREALLDLGPARVRAAALALTLRPVLDRVEPADLRAELWRLALLTGLSARRLAAEVGGWEPEEALLFGLLVDCGSLLLLERLPGYAGTVRRFLAGEADLIELERAGIETDHARSGALLLERWGFPAADRALVASHHDPCAWPAGSTSELRVRTLEAAWLCARALSAPGFAADLESIDRHLSRLLALPTAVARAVLSELPDELCEAGRLFDVPVDVRPGYEEMLQGTRGACRRTGPAWSGAGGSDELDRSALEREPETGLLTRRSFDALAPGFAERAARERLAIGLLLIELDDAKDAEERLGADALDEIVAEMAARTAHSLRRNDPVARFCRARLVALLPGCPTPALERAARRVLAATEDGHCEAGGERIALRLSIGVATAGPGPGPIDARALVARATVALEAARSGAEPIRSS